MRRPAFVSAPRSETGFSLAEMLVVIAILGLFCLIAIPAVGNYIRAARVRTANDLMMGDLRAVRYIAITNRVDSTLTIDTAGGTWNYADIHGTTVTRTLEPGVTFQTGTPASVTFKPDGTTTAGGSSIVIRGNVTNVNHTFTISITTVGRLSSVLVKS